MSATTLYNGVRLGRRTFGKLLMGGLLCATLSKETQAGTEWFEKPPPPYFWAGLTLSEDEMERVWEAARPFVEYCLRGLSRDEMDALSILSPPPNPTTREMQALFAYTGQAYGQVNSYLRGGTDFTPFTYPRETLRAVAHLVCSALNKLDEKLIVRDRAVYRGVCLKPHLLQAYQVGQTVIENGFLSTSSELRVARHYAGIAARVRRADLVGTVLEIQSCSGRQITTIHESEVLFVPGSRFRVIDRTRQDGFEHIRLRQIEWPLVNDDIGQFVTFDPADSSCS